MFWGLVGFICPLVRKIVGRSVVVQVIAKLDDNI